MIFYRLLCSKILLSIWEIYSLQIEPLQLRVTVKDNIRNNLRDRSFCSLQQVLISLGTLCLHMKIKRFSEILKQSTRWDVENVILRSEACLENRSTL